jgi:hypothetical protein
MCAPVLNLKLDKDVKAMRAIAEEALRWCASIGLAFRRTWRWPRPVRIPRADVRPADHSRLEEVKERSTGQHAQSGKIVHPPKMDDRSLFRYAPGYKVADIKTVMDWSAYPGAAGGFRGAVEMCNNNGAPQAGGRRDVRPIAPRATRRM